MTFPISPLNDALHSQFGRSYQYSEDNKSWRAATSPAPEINISTVTAFETATDLPLVNNNPGDTTFVAEDNSFRLWTGSGWFEIALINSSPTITTGANATYTLNSDGTPTVITMAATDPEGTPIIWGHQVTSGSLEDTTVTNVDGVFTITPGATDATFGLTFTASDGVNIDTSASSFTLVFIPDWTVTTLLHTLDDPNAYGTSASDFFGRSVAIDGNYAVVGAIYEDDDHHAGGLYSGKAYIFNVTTGALVHTLSNPNAYGPSSNDLFGISVAISGNYAIVSTNGEGDAGGANSGKAYIFDVTTGALVHTLNNPNAYGTSAGDYFGGTVAISGNYAIVGALNEDDGHNQSGKAYIFDVTTGALVHTLDNPNPFGTPVDDHFGEKVAISGNYAIVGVRQEDDTSGGNRNSSGKAYIYNVTTGALVRTLNNPNAYGTGYQDNFGYSVAISGNYTIICARGDGDAGGADSGKAYIFNVTTGALVHTLSNPNAYGSSDSDYFGESVGISGNYAIVSTPYEDDASGNDSGKAYIFDIVTGTLLKTLDNPNAYGTSAGDEFGNAVAISGDYVIVGAQYEDDAGGTNSGKAYIFKAG